MERVGITQTGKAIAYIKDGLEEINMLAETHVTTQRINIVKDQQQPDEEPVERELLNEN